MMRAQLGGCKGGEWHNERSGYCRCSRVRRTNGLVRSCGEELDTGRGGRKTVDLHIYVVEWFNV